jgi:hypothetical protein
VIDPSHPLARVLPRWGMAFSLAHLCLIRAWYATLYPAGHGYYNQIPVNLPLLIGLFINLILLTLLFKLVIFSVRRAPRVWQQRLSIVVLGLFLLIPVNFVRLQYLGISGAAMVAFLQHPAVWGGALIALALVWHWHMLALSLQRGLLLILLPLAASTVVQLLHLGVGLLHPVAAPTAFPLADVMPVSPHQPRVVWIIFDELDYRVTFENRPAHVVLPELDRLRGDSLFVTQAQEPGWETMVSMPALLNGQRVQSAEPVAENELRMTFAGATNSMLWSGSTQLFARARALGVNSAVVAWYHPYRRLFARDLAFCTDLAIPLFEQARGRTLGEAMANQLWSSLAPLQQRRLTIQVYQDGLRDALQVVTNPVYGLSLLHLLGPHEPGIYRPDQKRLTVTSFSTVEGYFNNLMLTDRALGEMRRAMEAAGQWDSTWVIVSADHRWRKADRYDGRIDHRVPFMVKAPGAAGEVELDLPLDTVLSHDLILAILRGEVVDAEAAREWLERRALGGNGGARV